MRLIQFLGLVLTNSVASHAQTSVLQSKCITAKIFKSIKPQLQFSQLRKSTWPAPTTEKGLRSLLNRDALKATVNKVVAVDVLLELVVPVAQCQDLNLRVLNEFP